MPALGQRKDRCGFARRTLCCTRITRARPKPARYEIYRPGRLAPGQKSRPAGVRRQSGRHRVIVRRSGPFSVSARSLRPVDQSGDCWQERHRCSNRSAGPPVPRNHRGSACCGKHPGDLAGRAVRRSPCFRSSAEACDQNAVRSRTTSIFRRRDSALDNRSFEYCPRRQAASPESRCRDD